MFKHPKHTHADAEPSLILEPCHHMGSAKNAKGYLWDKKIKVQKIKCDPHT